VIEGRKEGELL